MVTGCFDVTQKILGFSVVKRRNTVQDRTWDPAGSSMAGRCAESDTRRLAVDRHFEIFAGLQNTSNGRLRILLELTSADGLHSFTINEV